jgi:hypothetical protein
MKDSRRISGTSNLLFSAVGFEVCPAVVIQQGYGHIPIAIGLDDIKHEAG